MVLATRPRRNNLQVYPQQLGGRRPLNIYPDYNSSERLQITTDSLVGGGKFEPLTIMLAGRRGYGKTLSMTAVGAFFKAAYERHNVDVKIAANYNTTVATEGLRPDGDRWASPYLLEDLMEFPIWADELLVLVDEAATAFPRRRSNARINLDFSTFLQMIRKRNIELIFTTQFPGMLDDQLLINIDLYCMVNAWPKPGTAPFTNVTVAIWDWHGQFSGRFTRPRIPPDGPPTWRRTLYNVHTAYGLYNTKEVIGRLWGTGQQREAMAGQYWERNEAVAGEGEDSPALAEAQTVPTDLRSYLYNLPGTFNLLRVVPDARGWDDSVRTQRDLAERIAEYGDHEIVKQGSQWFARRK
jgi:hypothetical protein